MAEEADEGADPVRHVAEEAQVGEGAFGATDDVCAAGEFVACMMLGRVGMGGRGKGRTEFDHEHPVSVLLIRGKC